MHTSRRRFIKTTTVSLAGSILLRGAVFSNQNKLQHTLGIQLYTVRDDMKKDPAGTLKRLARIGYTAVEHAGYKDRRFYGYSPADFKQVLADTGLRMMSGHSFFGAKQYDKSKDDFTGEWKYTIEDAATVGMKYVISPGLDESFCKTPDDFKRYMALYNKAGELCKKAGITFAYHNESYEFSHTFDNTRLYDLLLSLTDASLVAQQIDIGNMYDPGGRAMDYLKRYPGRFALMHVKDQIGKSANAQNGTPTESTILGTGVVGVKTIIDYAGRSGTRHFIIEQESYQGKAPLDCAAEDLTIMKKWGY